jgi:AcrR family transcriptional regulator
MGRYKNFDRNDVLDIAIQLFWSKGYSETSLKDIEEATGVFKPSLYAEFKHKEGLYIQSLRRYGEMHPAREILSRKPLGWKNIEDLLLSILPRDGGVGCYAVNVIRDLPLLPKEARTIIDQNVAFSRAAILKNVKATGAVRNLTPVVDHILNYYYGASIRASLGSPAKVEAQIMDFVARLKQSI